MRKNNLIIILIISSLLLISNISNCQETIFKHYGIKEGLPSSETYHIFQDSKGYIWAATNKGVSRFNGYKFKNFDSQDGLADNTVFEIFEDNKERIWFIPISCQLSYFKNDSIYTYKYNNIIKNISENILPVKRSFYVDNSDNVYFSIKNQGLFKIDKNGNIRNLTKKHYQYDKINNKILSSHKGNSKSNKLFINLNNS
ncbi:MAG: two-component regulator propeller domain-containing protein, partial [Bacteroidota bacterium]|nr:two-component regulator propeller domain-containing protein [Bacteroidota bacterium]